MEKVREGLEVHHRDHNGGNNNLDNLEVLRSFQHRRTEGRWRKGPVRR